MTKASSLQPIAIQPGVMPNTDATPTDIPCWAMAQGMRFDPTTGRLRKIGGWVGNSFNYGATVSGTIRTVYSVTINQKVYTILGTNSNLYSQIGSELTNITPLDTVSVTAANSLATHYGTLGSDPILTATGSNSVTVIDADSLRYKVNDNYTLSGATTTNGVPNTELNAVHVIRSISSGTVTFRTPTAATSNGSGGGASVVRSDGLIRLTKAAHGLTNGQRVKISGAANTGGILVASINLEFIIRNAATNTFDVMTAGTSTSAVTGAGGGSTIYFPQIAAGALNQGNGQGYGAGLYGVGLYGTALVSSAGTTYPRIWFCDRFGDNIILTAGNQTGVYTWDGDTSVAPALVAGAPTDVNYAFESDNILVTLGHDVENKIFSSDIDDPTGWTASSSNQVFEFVGQGAGRLISHCPVDGGNLLYSEGQTYTFTYIGLPNVWQFLPLDPGIGIIAPMARISVNGIAYWMGQSNFYLYRGGKVEVIPSNFGLQSSMLQYVFSNLNYSQRFKCFAGYNKAWDEIWFHYPSQQSNECDRIARYSRKLQCWVPDAMERTAFESPVISLSNPRLADMSVLYTHESGANADGAPLPFFARSGQFTTGKDTIIQTEMIPDSVQTGNIDLQMRMYNFPQSTKAMNDKTYVVAPSTEKVPMQINGRFWDFAVSGDDLDQTYLMGQFLAEPQSGATAP